VRVTVTRVLHEAATLASAAFSRPSAVRPQRSFAATQSATYAHRDAAGGTKLDLGDGNSVLFLAKLVTEFDAADFAVS